MSHLGGDILPLVPNESATMEIPGLGILTQGQGLNAGSYYSQLIPIPVLGGKRCQLILDNYDHDANPTDFHCAIANFLAIGPSVLQTAAVHVFAYYQDCVGTADNIPIIASADAVWQYVHFRPELEIWVTRNDYVDDQVYVWLSCGCDWEDEHGLQLVFQQGQQVSRVGPNDGHLSCPEADTVYC
jgi:hypothetical protein